MIIRGHNCTIGGEQMMDTMIENNDNENESLSEILLLADSANYKTNYLHVGYTTNPAMVSFTASEGRSILENLVDHLVEKLGSKYANNKDGQPLLSKM